MEWSDEGLVIGARRLGETSLILDVMTRRHGRAAGVVRGGRSRRMQPLLQPGNSVAVTWRARLEEQLGHFTVEATRLRGAELMATPMALHGLNLVSTLLRLMPEREPHDMLCLLAEATVAVLDLPPLAPAALVRLEMAVLAESGFGLDLSSCAVTGRPAAASIEGRDGHNGAEALAFVSPRTGRAVSLDAGEPYRDRLYALPAFLLDEGMEVVSREEALAGFALTGHFLRRDLLAPRGSGALAGRDGYLALLAGGR